MNQQISTLSIDQIESLILTLYQPNQPQLISTTQATLTQLQSSPQAWSIARDLLCRPDDKVKFHGALIIIIKLNTESSTLRDNDATELLVNLVGWYLESVAQGAAPLVTRKLSSALATFLVHFYHLWGHYVRHLTACLASGQSSYPDHTKDMADIGPALHNIGSLQLRAALWVIGNIVEDASKIDLNTEKGMGLYSVIRQNTSDAVALMARALNSQPQFHEDSIKCLQSWIWFAQKASVRDKHFVDALRPLVALVIESLVQENSFDASMELLADVLSNYSGLLTEQHYDMIASILDSSWSQQRYQRLIQGDSEFESFQFGQLLLAFGDARVDVLMCGADSRSFNLLSSMCGLLSTQGYPAVEDKIFVPTLEFWMTFAETVTDEMYSDEGTAVSWAASAISYVLEAVSMAWRKIAYPPPEEFSEWDSSDRVSFNDARKDVADLLQSAYALSGRQLVFKFAELTLEALSASSWLQLEAAAYCLGALADCVKDDNQCDEALSSVFCSSLFETLRASHTNIPPRVRQTCVSLIEHYTEYFERNVANLPSALNLLFVLVGEQAVAAPASKSILRLCSSCRCHLHPEIGAFLDEYQSLSARQQLDCLSSERILGGIASVAQALPDQTSRSSACDRLVAFAEEDARRSLELIHSPSPLSLPCYAGSRCLDDADLEHTGLHHGLKALRCLASIGRGLQSPADAPIELDAGGTERFQASPQLAQLHQRIFGIVLQIQGTFNTKAEVTETICSILRCGFSESEPGLFVFSPEDVAHYLTRHTGDTPRIGVLVSTACSFVSSLQRNEVQNKQQLFSGVLLWVVRLIQHFPEPETDPELTQNAIEFSSRLITKNVSTLLQLQPSDAAEFFFLFTLRVLDGKEPLPKAAAADFWAIFASLKEDEAAAQAMNTLGPMLCQSIARNIGGNASRSELDKLSEPLKKLVVRHSLAKGWLEAALNDPSFPSSKITPEEKAMLVKKLISLRGSRQTNQVVRDFWLSARGASFAYAS